MSEVRERRLVAGNLETVVAEAGPGDSEEAVVFVHGNPGSARDWHDLMGRVGEFGRAVAADMPGFGRAEKPHDFPVPVAGHAQFLGDLLNELRVRRAHLVLHDFGGPWGLGWALSDPDRFASAVLIDTGVLVGFKMHSAGRMWARPVLGELMMAITTRGAFRKALARGQARPLPREYVDQMYDSYDRDTRRMVLRLYRNATDDSVLAAAADGMAKLDRPALVVWGARDPFVPLHHAEEQKRPFPRARVVVLEESGHWPFADDPEGTAEAVVPFLREQLGAGP